MTDTGAPLLKEDSKLLGNVKVEKKQTFLHPPVVLALQ
jgi:hypothetical protein